MNTIVTHNGYDVKIKRLNNNTMEFSTTVYSMGEEVTVKKDYTLNEQDFTGNELDDVYSRMLDEFTRFAEGVR